MSIDIDKLKSMLFNPVVVSIITSIIISYVTARIATRQEAQKRIYDEREKSYIMLFNLMQKLYNNTMLIYNEEIVIVDIRELRSRLMLYASKALLNLTEPFFDEIEKIYKNYKEIYSGEEYENKKTARIEYGEDLADIEREEEEYCKSHALSPKDIGTIEAKLIAVMRRDLRHKWRERKIAALKEKLHIKTAQ